MTATLDDEVRPGLAGWWDRLGRGQRAALVVVAAVAAVGLAGSALGGIVGGTPGGPVSSSFSTGDGGLQAWSELLARRDHPVTRLRSDVTADDLDPDTTAVVSDPQELDQDQAVALLTFLADGGRLVLAGSSSRPLVEAAIGDAVEAGSADGDLRPWLPVPETAGVADLVGGDEVWSVPAPLVGVVGDGDGGAAVAVAEVGRGRLVVVADAGLLQNAALAREDNAALALALVGPEGRPVLFVESVHGFGEGGWSAVPSSWKVALVVVAVALVLGLWGAATRFGPPEPDRRTLRPARRDHVDAVAADLDRVVIGEAERVEPLVTATRRALAARVGVPDDAAPAVLAAGAARVGIDPGDVDLVVEPVHDRPRALAVGAVAAARQRGARGLPAPEPDRRPAPDPAPDDPRTPGATP